MNDPKHEIDNIRDLEKRGFTRSYQVVNNLLVDKTSERTFEPSEVTIVEEYRYEGMSNPSDLSMLFAIQTADGNRGTLLIAYGPTGQTEAAEFMKEVSLHEKKVNNAE